MWPFTRKVRSSNKRVNENHIRACIEADPWMLYCAADCENGTLGYSVKVPWDTWWRMAKFGAATLSRYRDMFPGDEKPSMEDIERILRGMVKGHYAQDFMSDATVIGPGETMHFIIDMKIT